VNRRRTFLIASCAAASLVPLVGLGQQPRIPKVGLLFIDDPEPAATNIREALREAGYIDKKQIHIEIRTARGNADLLLQHATELVRANVDVILAVNTGAVQAAMQATTAIPIVMIAGAPLETGLVKSLNRPGGNVTGVTSSAAQLSAKTLEVMRDMLPSLRRIAVLVNANDSAFGNAMLEQVQSAARSIKIGVHGMSVRAEELDTAFAALDKTVAQAVMSQPSLPRARVVELALKHRIPLIAPSAAWPVAGAFMSYSGVQAELQRKAATYVVRILKGANPATMAVEHVTHYELVINLKTARALGLTVPPSVLARADRVIE
jgi:putative tryptophan/tyrosine transport system substrate-binding protein